MIYTELVNCGKIGKISLDSFHKYHPDLNVTVYGTKNDFDVLSPSNNETRVIVDNNIIEGYISGHKGTALLWSKIIKENPNTILTHFDSDVIFRDSIIYDMIEKSKDYDLIGPRRNYKYNPNNRDGVRHLEDVVQTLCFSFNTKFIDDFDSNTLTRMIQGYCPNHPIIDFFDSVSFNILKNGAKISFLDHDDVGGCSKFGDRDNKYKEYNNFDTPFKIDFGDKLIHYSAVGSGCNIANNRSANIPEGYKQYAKDRYALFCKIYYNEDIGIDLKKYEKLIDYFANSL